MGTPIWKWKRPYSPTNYICPAHKKYEFKVKDGQIINPTTVFFNDRGKYYEMLAVADTASSESMLDWCEYVLTGICSEISKVNKLLDHWYLSSHILKPAISLGRDRGFINKEEELVLKMGVDLQLSNHPI
jgi:hypothetical protein